MRGGCSPHGLSPYERVFRQSRSLCHPPCEHTVFYPRGHSNERLLWNSTRPSPDSPFVLTDEPNSPFVLMQSYRNISQILRDWKCAGPHSHLTVIEDCCPSMYSNCLLTGLYENNATVNFTCLYFLCSQLLQPKLMQSSRLKLYTLPCPCLRLCMRTIC